MMKTKEQIEERIKALNHIYVRANSDKKRKAIIAQQGALKWVLNNE